MVKKIKRTSITLDKDMYELLKLINRNTGIPISKVIEKALCSYLGDKLNLVKSRKWDKLIDEIAESR